MSRRWFLSLWAFCVVAVILVVLSGDFLGRKGVVIMADRSFLFDGVTEEFDKSIPGGGVIPYMHRAFKVNCVCRKEALGVMSKDGYKIMCADLVSHNPCIVYSLGSFGNFDFEHAVHKSFPHCKIFTFDKAQYDAPSFVTFKAATIGRGPGEVSIKKLLASLGHERHRISLFKIDIEGSEWGLMEQIFNDHFDQIEIEIHNVAFEHKRLFEKFAAERFCLADVAQNVICPQCLELLFINKRLL